MPDHSFATPEEVQYIGQTPDEIGQQLDALALREAEATRIALECRVKRAKLQRQLQEQFGLKGKQYVEFVSQHGGASRTDAYDMLLLAEATDDVLAPPDAANDPYYQFPHWRTVWRESKPATRRPKTDIGSRRQKPKRSFARRSALTTIHFLIRLLIATTRWR